ncbi:MAG: hypothetical protein ACPL25_02695 [Ignavibacteria bacterium]
MQKILYFLVFIIPFFVISCIDQIKEPVMPSWDVELNLPIGTKKITIEEIANRQEQIVISPARTLKFSTDPVEADTSLSFLFSNTFDMQADTSFPVIGTSIQFNMIAGRDSVRMDSAEIQDGQVRYRMKNNNAFPVSVSFTFPGFTRVTGNTIDTFKIQADLAANQTVEVTNQISNYKYKQPPNQPFGSTRPGVWIIGKLNSSVIGIGQTVEINFQLENLRFRSFSGKVKPFDLGSRNQQLENALSGSLKDFIKAVTFNQAFLTLTTSTTFKGFDVLLKGLQIVGRYKDGSPPVYLQFNGNNSKDILIPAGQTQTEIFSTLNTSINQFIKATPDSIEIKARLIMNPEYKQGSVNTADKISFKAEFEAYSEMKVENAVVTDTIELDWDQETKNKISQGNEANLQIEILNALPFDIQFVGYFMDRDRNKLFYFTRQLGTGATDDTVINIQSASINSSGEVSSPKKSTVNFSLNKTDFEKFKNAAYVVQRFRINSAQNQSVLLKADDYVSVKLFGRVNYRIKE